MTICKKCNAHIGDIGDPHQCPFNGLNQPIYQPSPLIPVRQGQKCDICGSTAIDHTENQCNINRQLKNINK